MVLLLINHLDQNLFVSTAHALATRKGIRVTNAHLEVAIAASARLRMRLQKGAGQVGNINSYTIMRYNVTELHTYVQYFFTKAHSL